MTFGIILIIVVVVLALLLKIAIIFLFATSKEERKKIMREDKKEILKAFTRVLQMTNCWENLDALLYDKGSEEVAVIVNGNEAKRINVAHESGYGMIQDIIKHLPA